MRLPIDLNCQWPAAMTNFQNRGAQFDTLADNVIVFPGTRRVCPAASMSPQLAGRPSDLTGADLNLRLLVLLGICVTSATLVLSAIHVVHG